jgi:hypothetical protein
LDLARLLFAVSHRGGTGTVFSEGPQARIELSRGWVYSLTSEPIDGVSHARAEELLARLL